MGPEFRACRKTARFLFELCVPPQRSDLALKISRLQLLSSAADTKATPLTQGEVCVRTKAKWPQGLRGGREGETSRLVNYALQICDGLDCTAVVSKSCLLGIGDEPLITCPAELGLVGQGLHSHRVRFLSCSQLPETLPRKRGAKGAIPAWLFLFRSSAVPLQLLLRLRYCKPNTRVRSCCLKVGPWEAIRIRGGYQGRAPILISVTF